MVVLLYIQFTQKRNKKKYNSYFECEMFALVLVRRVSDCVCVCDACMLQRVINCPWLCVCVFALLLCSMVCSYKLDGALLHCISLHLSPCQHVYCVCKESWAITGCGASRWGRSMGSSRCVCCEYSAWLSSSSLWPSSSLILFLLPPVAGLSTAMTYHWFQRAPSKTCRPSPTCE